MVLDTIQTVLGLGGGGDTQHDRESLKWVCDEVNEKSREDFKDQNEIILTPNMTENFKGR